MSILKKYRGNTENLPFELGKNQVDITTLVQYYLRNLSNKVRQKKRNKGK